jgi:hypothetical protein
MNSLAEIHLLGRPFKKMLLLDKTYRQERKTISVDPLGPCPKLGLGGGLGCPGFAYKCHPAQKERQLAQEMALSTGFPLAQYSELATNTLRIVRVIDFDEGRRHSLPTERRSFVMPYLISDYVSESKAGVD